MFKVYRAGFFSAIAALALAGCGSGKYAATEKVYKKKAREISEIVRATPPKEQAVENFSPEQQWWVGSVNFGIRKPNYVVIHHTAQDSLEQTIKTFHSTRAAVSSHYVVSRDGKIVQMVNDYLRANHAGIGKWGNNTDLNSSSIGIELDNNGREPWPDAQINSLITLLETLKKRYNIPQANFIGHADLAPKRKPDPANFPWHKLAYKGFGFWYDKILKNPPADFKPEIALKLMGYDTRDLPAAIVAFKRHFVQKDLSAALTPLDKLILYNVYEKYM
ncbi:N-acetylmuramoyl-L-alanine amidase [Pedobacter yulinensis]|uniref:N-acetylmuramoyl-L-alanine amidase n=1 Tax=Pedobacter yulinensis TaxID=2126353 RepID=A0A2T3HS85_9SPHI|nr:N-acetylmuramoyl-L-alanine amidase [Pedobacter yulinensis]PST85312.1 N-acetylmuramoyl-L-alanine amidase [Pedobacter yulinensis]